jgi:integrase
VATTTGNPGSPGDITASGTGGRARVVRIGHEAARAVDRYLRVRSRHGQAHRPQLWLGVNNRGPMTGHGIYQMIARRGRQAGVDAWTHRFRHHFSHTWLDRGGGQGAPRGKSHLTVTLKPAVLSRPCLPTSDQRRPDSA